MSTNDELKNETANGTKPVLCAGLIVIVQDWGRMSQNSFCSSEIWHGINRNKYKESQWIEAYGEERHKEIEQKAKAIGWDVKYVELFG
jgi:hypothetical protein